MLRVLAPRTQSLCAVEAFGNALLRQCEPILSSPPHENGSSSDRKRLASSTAGAAAAPLWHWQRRFEDVAPGSVLRLSLADTAAELAVEAGEHEAIELWSSSALRAQRGDNPAHGGGTLVEVSGGDSPADASAPAEPVLLAARAPSRFLSIEAASGGGRVHVEVVQEGSLRVDSGGGDISVPKVKAVEAHLRSGGGAITGSVTGAEVALDSGGGAVQLRSLVGKAVAVRSGRPGGGGGGGAITLGACYADALQLDSGGGPVHVTTMDCRGGLAVLCSGGGAVAVDSLDGSLRVESGGGAVAAQLADGAGRVSVASGGGDVQLFLSPGVAGQLRVRAAARVAARPGTLRLAEMQDDGSLLFRLPLESASGVAAMSSGFAAAAAAAAAAGAGAGGPGAPQPPPPPPSRLQRGGGAAGGAPPPPGNAVSQAGREAAAGAAIEIDAGGSGTLTLTQRSWADALRQRWS